MILNFTGCPHSELYMTPSGPFSMVTVDMPASVTTSLTIPKVEMSSFKWPLPVKLRDSLTHGSSCHLANFKSCNWLNICFRVFRISTSLPFSTAFSVNCTLLCTLARAFSSCSCWTSRDFNFSFLNSSTLSTRYVLRAAIQSVSSSQHSTTSCLVWLAQECTLLFISKTPFTAFSRTSAFSFVSARAFSKLSLPFENASFTNVYLWSRCSTMVQSLQIASSHVLQNSFITSPSCSLQTAGFVTAADPSTETRLCDLVFRARWWAWVQKAHRK